eukprot:8029909-Pyramimonas_sp.AAC.1
MSLVCIIAPATPPITHKRRIDPRLPLFDPSGVIHRLPFFLASDRFRLPDFNGQISLSFKFKALIPTIENAVAGETR